MQKTKFTLVIALLVGFTQISLAQLKLNGNVTDTYGYPLPGVNVIVKGTSNGTVTDFDGNYTITVSENTNLVFSYIGFTEQEVLVSKDQTTLNVALKEDVIGLEEVVTIGYGATKKSDLTGAVASVKSDDIIRANPLSTEAALQGQVAGVVISKGSNRPGSGYNINIRGLNSLTFSNHPLVVIDGLVDGDMNLLNPADIEKIDVLKDASSTAIYGSRGANGVIIITTKGGKTGKPSVSYDGYWGLKVPQNLPDMQNAQEWYQASRVDRVELGGSLDGNWTETEQYNVDNGRYVNWIEEVTEPGVQTSHTLSMNGGTEDIKYYASAGYLREDGNQIYTGYERYNLTGRLNAKINKYINVGFTTNYSYSEQDLGSNEALRSAYRARPTGVVYYDDVINPGPNEINWRGYAVWMGGDDSQVINPLVEAHPDNFQTNKLNSNFQGNAFIKITPIKGLDIKSSISARKFDERRGVFKGTMTKNQRTNRDPLAEYDSRIMTTYTWDNIISYNKRFGIHKLNITGAQSLYSRRNESLEMDVENLPFDSLWYAMGTAGTIKKHNTNLTERTLSSFMGRIVYDLNDKYLFTVTGRYDGASQLAEGHKWDFFPSAAVAWKASEESFIQDIDAINSLKLRVSYGLVGNAAVNPYVTQAGIIGTNYAFGETPTQGFSPWNLADKSLGWEKSKEINLGLDFGILHNRIFGTIEVYKRNTDDLIFNEKVPESSGFSDAVTNIGEVQNQGIEVVLNTINVSTKDFRWKTNFNFAKNKNEVISIGSEGITQDIGSNLFVGHPIDVNYALKFDGIWQLDEEELARSYGQRPGEVKVVDLNDDGEISPDHDRMIIGNRSPKWTLGMTNRLEYKNFDLSCLVYTSQGVQYRNGVLAGTMGIIGRGRYNALDLNYWMPDNPTNDYFAPAVQNPYKEAIFYQDASFVRIKDITFGYTLPKKVSEKINIDNLRIYTQVINPFIFHNFDGMDPEYNSSIYNDDVISATYLLGIKCAL